MKIAISGAFCSGKTTLVTLLTNALPWCVAVPEQVRRVIRWSETASVFDPNVRSYLLCSQLMAEAEAAQGAGSRVIVSDGGVISNLAHDDVLLGVGVDVRYPLLTKFRHIPYDLVFVCDYEDIPFQRDGERLDDLDLRRGVDASVWSVCDALGYEAISLPGTPGERLETILRALEGAKTA